MIASRPVLDRSHRRELRDAAWLALVPGGVALVLGLLLAPRRPAPEGVPLPVADAVAVARVTSVDHALAESARTRPLSGAVRALGSALRDFHAREARDADARELGEARRSVDVALIDALHEGVEPLRALRALQLEAFIDEVTRFDRTGEETAELQALAGGFVRSMRAEGWCDEHTIAPDTAVLRVMFKEMWQRFLGLDDREALDPTLDEQRLLYAFYLSHPHPSKAAREAIASARRAAHDAKACAAVEQAERAAAEAWRLDRIARLAVLDPSYPADYARGVASFRRGDYRASARAFRAWIDGHPEGPLALRAQNYARAAADAAQLE
ncbi:MAG TPA: hypothetical protein VE987_12655 [Polyangiaceae bacterium]|nr:hypothetical protein [Polyangiaceae bacterium]